MLSTIKGIYWNWKYIQIYNENFSHLGAAANTRI